MNDKVLAGQQVWQDSKCISCHAIYGLGGHMGPDLTNAVTRAGDETIIAVLRYGMGAMPPQELADGEAEELVAYLRYVDSTGVYPTRSFPGFAFGRTGQD
ncbi:MAG: c-type cytochrome [Parvularculaceae bacterium]